MTANPQTCPQCGSPVTPGMKFCESCGARIEALPACQKCGAPLAPEVKFCESCGASVSPPDATVIPAPAMTVPPVAAQVSPAPEPAVPEAPRPVPVKEALAEAATVAAAAAAVVAPAPEKAPVEETTPPAEAPAKEVEMPAPPPVEKPAPVPVAVKEPPITEKVKEVPAGTGPKQPGSNKTVVIAGIIVLALLGAAVYFVVLPMVSGPGTASQNLPVTPVPTGSGSISATPVITAAFTSQAGTVELTAGPTQVPPPNLGLIIDVERDAITHIITVTFQGGPGQYGVRELVVTLTKSDGTVERKSFKPENRGTFITLKGTEKTDRVEITANYYNGESYKVVDKVFEYKKRVGSP